MKVEMDTWTAEGGKKIPVVYVVKMYNRDGYCDLRLYKTEKSAIGTKVLYEGDLGARCGVVKVSCVSELVFE